jgi:hypothetical protein
MAKKKPNLNKALAIGKTMAANTLKRRRKAAVTRTRALATRKSKSPIA